MVEDRNSYRNITKSISIFGGTKVFQILVGIIKNKIIAVLLGPYGMGISGMITASTDMISSFSGLGLQTSAVRDISRAFTSNDTNKINYTVSILRRLVIFTGFIGMLITFLFAKQLSIFSFGNEDWTLGFRMVSILLFINQLVIGQNVLLQGTFHYKYMAKSALLSSVFGLIVTIPMYYIWYVDAIVPSLVVSSLIGFLITSIYSRKIKYDKVKLSLQEVVRGGHVMITLGLAFALAGFVNYGMVYIERNILTKIGNLEVVGIYTAGVFIVSQYINIIFQAMGSDYTPRLSAIADEIPLFIKTINRQSVLLNVLFAPLIMIFIVFAKDIIKVLYTPKFLVMSEMISWMMFGTFFRAISWSISYSYTARGEGKKFFINELVSACYSLLLIITGYYILGYSGMGYAFCISNFLYVIQNYIICHISFGYKFNNEVITTCLPMIAISFIFVIILQLLKTQWLHYSLGIIFIILISYISYKKLDKMISLNSILISIKNKIFKK